MSSSTETDNSAAIFLPLLALGGMIFSTWLSSDYATIRTVVALTPAEIAAAAAEIKGKPNSQQRPSPQNDISPPTKVVVTEDRGKKWRRLLFLALGWAATLLLLFQGFDSANLENFDPHEILGLSSNATEADAKRVYRRLSMELHPDRMQRASPEEKAVAERRFIRITQAYKSLTDEKARKNYETYGHPDGPRSMSVNLAVPEWMTKKENAALVLLMYMAGLGLMIWAIYRRLSALAREREAQKVKTSDAAKAAQRQQPSSTERPGPPNKKKV